MYSETTYTVTSSGLSGGESAAAFGIMMLVVVIFSLIGYAIFSWLLSRIFKKAGVEAWKAWVPIYNTWTMLEMGDQKGFWAVLMFVPFVNFASIIFYYIAMYHIGRKFGKEDWFIALAIFLPIVWIIILAFDKSQWNGGNGAQPVAVDTQSSFVPPAQVDNSQPVVTTQPTYSAEPVAQVMEPTFPVNPTAPVSPLEPNPAQPTDVPTQSDTYNQPPNTPPTNNFN